NERGDPVNVGSGALSTHPATDVRYVGLEPAIEFTRIYTSTDRWFDWVTNPLWDDKNRLASGWFHTFNEQLFRLEVPPPPTGHSVWTLTDERGVDPSYFHADPTNLRPGREIIHRDASGRGRLFVCDAAAMDGT